MASLPRWRKLYWLLSAISLGLTFSDSYQRHEHCSADSQCGGLVNVPLADVEQHVYDKCILLAIPPVATDTQSILLELNRVFRDDSSSVLLGLLAPPNMNISDATNGVRWKRTGSRADTQPLFAFYAREKRDRSCLLLPPRSYFLAEPYQGMVVLETLVQFLNEKCGTFRTTDGGLTEEGLLHQHIMHNLFSPTLPVEQCQRVKAAPSKREFFQEYAFRSKPVVFENAVHEWPAMQKWTAEFLRQKYGQQDIHIKLTPDGVFEGVESAKLWSQYSEDWIPTEVKSQLPYPDLVVVRPATSEMKFSDFLDFISSGNRTFSAYLEYSSIPYYMPTLQQDMFELPFVEGILEVRHLNMWLSDGNTLGKLHFDPFDNFLCQVSGEKRLTLFDPHHNENLYEAHVPEAILDFSSRTGQFHRRRLLESTSMVMSPVDIQDPDMDRFPRFAEARRVECSLKPGDVLFMPAFWWHEVQSRPDPMEKRNLAVNFWYEPVLTKEFPCAECRLHFNPNNRHLLLNSKFGSLHS